MNKLTILLLGLLPLSLAAQQTIQWRGTDRTGIYNETGLLKEWPADGPEMLWYYDGLGEGHSSVAIASDKIYITGMTDGEGYLYVLDLNGKLLHKKEYVPEWDTSYNGSRGTPTVSDVMIYLYSGTGDLYYLNEQTLDIVWSKNIESDFGASNIRWGVNESPFVIGEKVVFTPGGKEHNIVALNKRTGALIWSCAGEEDLSAYCSALYLTDQEVLMVVTITANHIIGIDAGTGEKLWSHPYKNQRNVHANTPVYSNNRLLCTFEYGKGSVMLQLKNGGKKVEQVWEQKEIDSKTGRIVKVGDHVYGSGDNNKYWYAVNWQTGEISYKDNTLPTGAVIAADGMLYCYSDRGDIALVKITPEKFGLISRFPVTLGTDQHWAHPVIYRGTLYVRHGNALMAYKIK